MVHQFGQVYLVGNPARGTIRAFHKHEELWDWFFISHGSAKFVLSDDRAGSRTHGALMTIIASARKPRLIVVPPGVYHGWMSLEDDTQMVSTASHVYNHAKPDEVRIPRTRSAMSGRSKGGRCGGSWSSAAPVTSVPC